MSVITFHLQGGFSTGDVPSRVLVGRITVGLDFALDMLPYPTARRSVVARSVFQDAIGKLGGSSRRGDGILLQDVRIARQPVPDLFVHPSLAPSRLAVDGFLGLDFFSWFDLVDWRPKSWWMQLTTE